jgi:cysteine desulfurase
LNILMNSVPGVKIVGNDTDRLWNTVSLILPQHDNTRWVIRLDKLGFAVSTGSACASGKEGPSHVLAAMKYSPDEMQRVVRISGGSDTSRKTWHELGEAFSQVWKDLNTSSSGSNKTRIVSI